MRTTQEWVGENPLASDVLASDYIFIENEGSLDVPYDQALHVLNGEELLNRIQLAYADLLPEGEQPEFVIRQDANGTCSFVNKYDQYAEVVELVRERQDNGDMTLILFSQGERGFGNFKSLTHVQVTPSETPGNTDWSVQVYAYPENAFSRFFARHLRLVDRYFKKKTAALTELTE